MPSEKTKRGTDIMPAPEEVLVAISRQRASSGLSEGQIETLGNAKTVPDSPRPPEVDDYDGRSRIRGSGTLQSAQSPAFPSVVIRQPIKPKRLQRSERPQFNEIPADEIRSAVRRRTIRSLLWSSEFRVTAFTVAAIAVALGGSQLLDSCDNDKKAIPTAPAATTDR